MKHLFKVYWFDFLIVGTFLIFTFIIPIRIISILSAGIIAVCLIQIVLNDKRIQDPYSSIMGFAVFIAYGLFIAKFWI